MAYEALREWPVNCPYCDAPFTLLLDVSAGGHVTWEDCAVCCQPIQLRVDVDAEGELETVTLATDDDVL